MDMRIEHELSKNLKFSYITAKFSMLPNAKQEPKIYSKVGFITTTLNHGFDIAPNKQNVYILREFYEYIRREKKVAEFNELIFGPRYPTLSEFEKNKLGAHTEFWVIDSL